jgi:carboxypeptidase Q
MLKIWLKVIMRLKIYPLYLALFLLLTALGFTLKKASVFLRIVDNVNQKGKAYENLGLVTKNIGHRLTGSPEGKQAEEFVFQKLKEYNLENIHFQSFELNSWIRNSNHLSIAPFKSDNFRDIKSIALAHTPQVAEVLAQIVDCGDGLESDFDEINNKLLGKIAMFNVDIRSTKHKDKKNLHRSEKTALAIKYGATGVILVNKAKNGALLTGTASTDGELIPIPAVCVSYESGGAIRKWIRDEKNIMAEIAMTNNYRPVRARNVSGTISGKSEKEGRIVVGAHLDSWDLAQGAIDNGLGSFSILDVARIFSDLKLKPKRPIDFVFFTGEEQGLLGSRHYLKELKASGKDQDIALMINLDMINNCHGFNAMGDNQLKKLLDDTGKKIKLEITSYPNINKNMPSLHSDHQPFLLSGIPVCAPDGKLSEEAINCYHADCDKFNLINKAELNNNVKYIAMMIYELANSDALPKRKTEEETRQFLTALGLKNELILGNDWPWGEK